MRVWYLQFIISFLSGTRVLASLSSGRPAAVHKQNWLRCPGQCTISSCRKIAARQLAETHLPTAYATPLKLLTAYFNFSLLSSSCVWRRKKKNLMRKFGRWTGLDKDLDIGRAWFPVSLASEPRSTLPPIPASHVRPIATDSIDKTGTHVFFLTTPQLNKRKSENALRISVPFLLLELFCPQTRGTKKK